MSPLKWNKRTKTHNIFVTQETKVKSHIQLDEIKHVKEGNKILKNENESLVKVSFQLQQHFIYISYRNILKINHELLFAQKTFLWAYIRKGLFTGGLIFIGKVVSVKGIPNDRKHRN